MTTPAEFFGAVDAGVILRDPEVPQRALQDRTDVLHPTSSAEVPSCGPSTMHTCRGAVPRTRAGVARLSDELREEAAKVWSEAFEGVSGKRINSVRFPGVTRHGVSRAANGAPSNPLYRIAVVFIVMKRLGLGRERAQRIVDFLQWVIDWLYGDEEEREPKEVLAEDQRLRLASEAAQTRLAWGEPGAAGEALEIARAQRALAPTVVHTLRRLAAAEGAS